MNKLGGKHMQKFQLTIIAMVLLTGVALAKSDASYDTYALNICIALGIGAGANAIKGGLNNMSVNIGGKKDEQSS